MAAVASESNENEKETTATSIYLRFLSQAEQTQGKVTWEDLKKALRKAQEWFSDHPRMMLEHSEPWYELKLGIAC